MQWSAEHGLSVALDGRLVPSWSGIRTASSFLLFALVLAFGGGTKQGIWSDALIEIVSLPVLAIVVWRLRWRELDGVTRWGVLLAAVILLIPVLELVPLPPALWPLLPGRSQIAQELSLVGLEQTWLPLTLAPRECWMALFALIPAVTSFIATTQLDSAGRRTLIIIFLAWTCIGVGLSFAQFFGGPESVLRFYAQTNLDRAVGFFANANHNALALSLAIPFLVLSQFAARRERGGMIRFFLVSFLLIVIVLAVVLTKSRAGLGLVFLAVTLSGSVVLLRAEKGRHRRQLLVAALCLVALAVLASFQAGFLVFSDRLEAPLAEDLRWGLLHVSYNAALQFLPLGSGLGSFVPVYERFAPLTLLHTVYVNHAHDDWIELFVELGFLLPVVVSAFTLWVGFAVRDQWCRYGRASLNQLAQCLIALLLAVLASAVDYPLRTIALMSAVGMVCGLLTNPPEKDVRQ